MLNKEIFDGLTKLIDFIHKNSKSFIDFLGIGNIGLIEISFTDDYLIVEYIKIDENGKYVDNDFLRIIVGISAFNEWLNQNNYEALITAEMVKQLRELSQEPLSLCKRALIQTNGDIELSNLLLRSNRIK